MKMLQSRCHVVLFLLTLFSAPHDAAEAGPFSEIVVIGDSESDAGNVFDLSGDTYPPSPPYWEGRFSNGPTWIGYLAPLLGVPVPTASRTGGENYAYGYAQTGQGSTVVSKPDGAIYADFPGEFEVPNLGAQIDSYLSDGGQPDATTLFVVFGGYNDIERGLGDPVIMTSNMSEHILTLSNAGGRNFLVPNLLEGSSNVGQRRRQFNQLLSAELEVLEGDYEINVFRLDIAGLWQQVSSNPASFGITSRYGRALNTDTGNVVPNPDEYLWWDDFYHQTTRHHEIRAQAAYDLILSEVPEPSTFILLGMGAVGLRWPLAWRRKRRIAAVCNCLDVCGCMVFRTGVRAQLPGHRRNGR